MYDNCPGAWGQIYRPCWVCDRLTLRFLRIGERNNVLCDDHHTPQHIKDIAERLGLGEPVL